jgi:hypothetical protein
MSITLPSIKNSRKYFLTSGTDGLSGVPRFTISTAFFVVFTRIAWFVQGAKIVFCSVDCWWLQYFLKSNTTLKLFTKA